MIEYTVIIYIIKIQKTVKFFEKSDFGKGVRIEEIKAGTLENRAFPAFFFAL
jgi:hypothetical protein